MTVQWNGGPSVQAVPSGSLPVQVPSGASVQPVPVSQVTYIGPSAYDLAVEQGFVGTLQQWLDSLKAPSYIHTQTAAAAAWIIPNPIGRLCSVEVIVDERQVLAEVDITEATVTVTFPSPQSGSAVLT